ncbi:acyltransferase [Burkholderia sp. FERM BP-3421]|uniref:acyltransferase family protein n=1 Tax=Burkholderia sp. FERM BP-3421 TaxID=1494466 RepID=UPI00235F4B2A|nr:acyltransferase [Burkholderia sp. FERM BP-3421]WDD95887.1 acyltransferase [Burkholderia sp. FERM BP-3421]
MRETYLDTARGAGIFLVVFGHALRGVGAAGLVPDGAPAVWAAALDYTIHTFHMPLFFLLSGRHVERALRGAGHGFLPAQLRAVAHPYLLWSGLQGAAQLVMTTHGTNHAFGVADLLAIGWRPFGQFWFLYALMLCMLLAWALAHTAPALLRAHGPLAGLAALGLALGASTHWGIVSLALMNWPFFALGLLANEYLPRLVARGATPGRIAASGAAFAAAVLFAHGHGEADSVWAMPAALAGIALTLQLAWRADRMRDAPRWRIWLESAGIASMPIYLTHILVTASVRIALQHAGVATPAVATLALHLALGTTAGLAAPMLLYALTLRAGLAGVAGFPPLPHAWAIAWKRAA